MAITGIHYTDLVIYTSKGILIVPVEFNEQFWRQILDKHLCFLLYSRCLSFFLESVCVVSILRRMVFTEIRVFVVG